MAEKVPSRGEIFVVDDDPAVRDTLSMVLTAGGYQVICFADGAALLAVALVALLLLLSAFVILRRPNASAGEA